MRTKNSLLNFLTSIVPFVVFVALGFLKIRVWQSSLDENIYALNQLFFQLFAYLSIAEAGIGALVQKEYYKLLIDEDHDMICKYYTVSKKMLRTVCYVIMAAGLILSFFLKYLAKDNALTQMYMQEVFLLFLAKSLVEYFMFSPRFVLTADQKLYKINFQMYFYRILETLMEIGLIYVGMSYVLVLCCSIVLRIVMNLHLNKIVFREYPWLHTVSDTQGLKIEGMKHVFIYKIVSAIQENVGALLISAFVNPISVIIYSNYKYITKYVNDFMYQMGVALTSSLGNLLYGENNEEGYVMSAPKSRYRIKLSEGEAKKMLFWNYYSNSGKKENTRWGTGLFRYMTDQMAVQVLRDIADMKKGTKYEKSADDLLKYFCSINNIDLTSIGPEVGALKQSE